MVQSPEPKKNRRLYAAFGVLVLAAALITTSLTATVADGASAAIATTTVASKATSKATPHPSHSSSKGRSKSGSTASSKRKIPPRCPKTRSANPSLWDACHAGYVAPTIQMIVVACSAIDRNAGDWKVTVKFSLVGGNYKRFQWSGLSNNTKGLDIVTVKGLPVSALTNVLPVSSVATALIKPMNGIYGFIDSIYYSDSVDVALANFCS
jgi:hypothetical protein